MSTPDAFKERDSSSYDPVAEVFARWSRKFSKPLARRMVTMAGLADGDSVLDVGTGTGIVALEAAPLVLPRGRVVGIDLSEGMLAVARTPQAPGTEFRRMDAENLDFGDGTFDVVLSLFAVHHFPDPLRAMREMHRVLRPGGRVVLAVGSGPSLFSRAGLAAGLRRIGGTLRTMRGRELAAPAFLDALVEKYFPETERHEQTAHARHGHAPTSLPTLVGEAGFSSPRTHWQGDRPSLATPEEFWEVQQTYSSLARKRLAAAEAGKVERLRAEFLEASRGVLARGGRLVYPYGAFFIAARRV